MDDIQDGNPAVIGKPLRPVALRPLLSKGVPLLKVRLGCCTQVRLLTYYGTLLVILCHPARPWRSAASAMALVSAGDQAQIRRGRMLNRTTGARSRPGPLMARNHCPVPTGFLRAIESFVGHPQQFLKTGTHRRVRDAEAGGKRGDAARKQVLS